MLVDLILSSSASTVSLLPTLPSRALRGKDPSRTLRGSEPSRMLRGSEVSRTLRGKEPSRMSRRSEVLEPPTRETMGDGVPDLLDTSASSKKHFVKQ